MGTPEPRSSAPEMEQKRLSHENPPATRRVRSQSTAEPGSSGAEERRLAPSRHPAYTGASAPHSQSPQPPPPAAVARKILFFFLRQHFQVSLPWCAVLFLQKKKKDPPGPRFNPGDESRAHYQSTQQEEPRCAVWQPGPSYRQPQRHPRKVQNPKLEFKLNIKESSQAERQGTASPFQLKAQLLGQLASPSRSQRILWIPKDPQPPSDWKHQGITELSPGTRPFPKQGSGQQEPSHCQVRSPGRGRCRTHAELHGPQPGHHHPPSKNHTHSPPRGRGFALRAAVGHTPPKTAPARGQEPWEGGQAACRRQQELKHDPTPGSHQRLVSTASLQFPSLITFQT